LITFYKKNKIQIDMLYDAKDVKNSFTCYS